MTRSRTPWPRLRRPGRRALARDRWRHEDHLVGEQLPEATHVARGLR